MREVNLVDYAPWLRRGLIGCIVQALVFIGLSGNPFFPRTQLLKLSFFLTILLLAFRTQRYKRATT
jgi:hypothetical protein